MEKLRVIACTCTATYADYETTVRLNQRSKLATSASKALGNDRDVDCIV